MSTVESGIQDRTNRTSVCWKTKVVCWKVQLECLYRVRYDKPSLVENLVLEVFTGNGVLWYQQRKTRAGVKQLWYPRLCAKLFLYGFI